MVAIFVAFMFVGLILTDLSIEKWKAWQVARASRAIAQPAHTAEALWQIPEGVGLSTAHTWSRADGAGRLKIGADPLLAYTLGAVNQITLPKVGKQVVPGQPLFAIENNGRRLIVPSTITGKVVAVNRLLQKQPALLHSDPFRHGWVCRLEAPPATAPARNTRSVEYASRWLEHEFTRLSEFLAPRIPVMSPLGVTSQDGGFPAPGCLCELPKSTWKEFATEFLRWQ